MMRKNLREKVIHSTIRLIPITQNIPPSSLGSTALDFAGGEDEDDDDDDDDDDDNNDEDDDDDDDDDDEEDEDEQELAKMLSKYHTLVSTILTS